MTFNLNVIDQKDDELLIDDDQDGDHKLNDNSIKTRKQVIADKEFSDSTNGKNNDFSSTRENVVPSDRVAENIREIPHTKKGSKDNLSNKHKILKTEGLSDESSEFSDPSSEIKANSKTRVFKVNIGEQGVSEVEDFSTQVDLDKNLNNIQDDENVESSYGSKIVDDKPGSSIVEKMAEDDEERKRQIDSEYEAFEKRGQGRTILSIRNLQVFFKQKRKKQTRVIRGVDISLNHGQIVGIVGESGSGKSVSTRALMNINQSSTTTCDEYLFFDQNFNNYKKINWKKIRGHEIAYIPQNPMTSMNPTRKIGRQVFDVINAYRKSDLKSKQDKLNYVISIFSKFKIADPKGILNLYPHELSGGMKQRVIIALGIMAGAKILIADEPTTALDPTVQSSVLKLLQDVNKDFGLSIIFISHNIATIAKLCHYVYVMYAGKVVEKASTRELFTNPKHPYTWSLISSIPENVHKGEKLYSIPGMPPDLSNPPLGDPFAPRNKFAVALDFKQEPPLFEVSPSHYAATWTLHPLYPKLELPKDVKEKLEVIRRAFD